jgi:two-component sensor histidine kinase
MALIHEKLYKTKDLSRVDFADYLLTLGDMMSRSYGGTRASVRIAVDADPAWLAVDTAIPVGLILNELVTNSMKHAFSEGDSGTVSITFRDLGETRYKLEVDDDGDGLPSSFSIESDSSLGLRLLRILTGQVEGDLVFVGKTRGSRFALTFKDVSGRSAAR